MVSLRDDPDEFLRSLETECAAGISPRAFAPLAEVYRLDGRLEDALRVARQGLGSYPTHVGIRLILARTLIDIGDGDGASEEYRLVLKGDPENVEAAAYLEAGAMSDVAPEPPGVSPTDDGEPVAAVDGASASRTGEQVTSLSDELQHLSELFATPTGPRASAPDTIATLTLAEIYAKQGLADKAVEVCEAILVRDPSDEEAARKLEEYRKDLASIG
jgi:tetratricopeptide (TPR) repeat protein